LNPVSHYSRRILVREGRAEPATSVSKATRRRRLGGGWLPSPVRFSGMMMLLLLRPAAARWEVRGIAKPAALKDQRH